MGSITGFTLYSDLAFEEENRAISSGNRALQHFAHLEKLRVAIGSTTLHVWGHSKVSDRIHRMPDGTVLALVGSVHNEVPWMNVQESLLKAHHPQDFVLPWDGRVILLRVSADGACWTLWNDWMGSIPSYYAKFRKGRIATTIEPVAVAATDDTLAHDVFLPGLVSLLLNGYFISDWTLYKNIKTIPPDSMAQWDKKGFRSQMLLTVQPSQARWETSWNNLVDEMHELFYRAIADIGKSQSTWALPLSSGLDSRMIAGVLADAGVNVRTYAWGGADNTDVIFSREIAKTLGFPWKHISLPKDFLVRYTPLWADWFGSGMHFHGMYLMSFLDALQEETVAPTLNGFIGDVLTGRDMNDKYLVKSNKRWQIGSEWYVHWTPDLLRAAAKFPVEEALEANAASIREQTESFPGAGFQRQYLSLPLRNRQRSCTSFLPTLMDHWRGTASPFLNRAIARFCFSLPRAALDDRRLLGDVFVRHYGKLAVIPGTYAPDPYILTGRYLIRRRVGRLMPESLRHRILKGVDGLHVDVNFDSIHKKGKEAFWPLFETANRVAEWLDFSQIEKDFRTVMASVDVRPLRRLQSVQTLAYRLHKV